MTTSLTVCAPRLTGRGIQTLTSFTPCGRPEITPVYVASNVFDFSHVNASESRATATMTFFMRIGNAARGRCHPEPAGRLRGLPQPSPRIAFFAGSECNDVPASGARGNTHERRDEREA